MTLDIKLSDCIASKYDTKYKTTLLKNRIELILKRKEDIYKLDCVASVKRRIDKMISAVLGLYHFCCMKNAFYMGTEFVKYEYGENNVFYDKVVKQKQVNLKELDKFDLESYENGMIMVIAYIAKFYEIAQNKVEQYRQYVYDKLGIEYK